MRHRVASTALVMAFTASLVVVGGVVGALAISEITVTPAEPPCVGIWVSL